MTLTPTAEKFVLHWGEMGSRWGINRTVAQVHALLYVSPEPLHAEEITRLLGVARSNVSTSLRELQAWGVVKVVHVMGDRRDHFGAVQDVWELFQIIMDERKRREIDPTIAMLRECVEESQNNDEAFTHQQMQNLLNFFETGAAWYVSIRKLPRMLLMKFMQLGDRVLHSVDRQKEDTDHPPSLRASNGNSSSYRS